MFHAHGARALDQDPVRRPQRLEQGVLDVGAGADDNVGAGHAAAAGAGGGLGGQDRALERLEHLDHRSGHLTTDLLDLLLGLGGAAARVAAADDGAGGSAVGRTLAGVVVDHLRPAAAAGLVGLGFSNSPAAMPAAGGRHPIFGTNPVAAVFPRRDAEPLLIDLSLSEVARGKVMVAAKQGKAIPPGWALDAQGEPTTDAQAALAGSMLPLGAVSSPKGAMLALMVELLVSAVIGAHFGFEASSFFVDEGNRPNLGQLFIVIDPGALAGRDGYFERVEVLIAEMLGDDEVRLPGVRREALRRRAETEGIEVAEALVASWGAAA